MPAEDICGHGYKNCEFRYVFNYCERTDRGTDKWTIPLDSGHQIDLEIILNGILTTCGKCSLGRCDIGRSILALTDHYEKFMQWKIVGRITSLMNMVE